MAEQQPIINLEWMDEEVRRYRAELIAAQQRINSQDEEMRELTRHIEDLEGRLASQQTQLNRINVLERALEQYKEEIRLLVEQQEEAYQQDRREGARIKLIEQATVTRWPMAANMVLVTPKTAPRAMKAAITSAPVWMRSVWSACF